MQTTNFISARDKAHVSVATHIPDRKPWSCLTGMRLRIIAAGIMFTDLYNLALKGQCVGFDKPSKSLYLFRLVLGNMPTLTQPPCVVSPSQCYCWPPKNSKDFYNHPHTATCTRWHVLCYITEAYYKIDLLSAHSDPFTFSIQDAVAVLLKHSADVNARDKNWQTPLHVAASNKAVRCAEALVPLLSNVNVSDRAGRTALHHAAFSGHVEVCLF